MQKEKVKMKIKKVLPQLVMAAALLAAPMGRTYASEDEYITISVEASDDNEGITYAIDSPDNFSPSNTFRIPAGTSHTIYVKDAAGNITSQTYTPPVTDNAPDYTDYTDDYTYTEYEESSGTEPEENSSNDRTINIDLELGKSKDKAYEKTQGTPAEPGEGSLYSKTFLDGTDSSEQVFYSVTTQEGDVFYLLVDQGQEQNNVYLLSQVTNQDLDALAADGGTSGGGNAGKKDDEEDSLLKALSGGGNEDAESGGGAAPKSTAKGGINGNALIVLVIVAVGGGVYYYQKVYKTKKEQEMDAMDAADMDQFEAENEEDDEYDFGYDDVDKDEFLRELMAKDEAGYAAAATEEAAAGGWAQGKEADAETAHEKYATSHIPEPDNESSRNINEAADDIFYDGDAADDIFGDGIDEDGYDPELDGEEED